MKSNNLIVFLTLFTFAQVMAMEEKDQPKRDFSLLQLLIKKIADQVIQDNAQWSKIEILPRELQEKVAIEMANRITLPGVAVELSAKNFMWQKISDYGFKNGLGWALTVVERHYCHLNY